MNIAILDDYQNVALEMADWSALSESAEITVFSEHVADPSTLVERLLPFDVVCIMRERTPLPREAFRRLSRLRLIALTGSRNASIDMGAAKELGITLRRERKWRWTVRFRSSCMQTWKKASRKFIGMSTHSTNSVFTTRSV